MHGVLNVNKPAGISSHDVVLQVRRVLGEKRVGHTGTLDPLARGVLVVCVGKATRIAQYLEAGEKEYEAVMRLGAITDTLDAEGRVIETRDYEPPGRQLVLGTLHRFTGSIMQRPPAYSAVKVSGVPSYKLARSGKVRIHEPRPVTIHGIELMSYDDPLIGIRVRCSKGVYIRTLCSDIGDALGCGAHLTSLIRTRSGAFRIENSIALDHLLPESGIPEPNSILMSMDQALADIPSIMVGEDETRKIAHGNRIIDPGVRASLVRIHDGEGRLLALARAEEGEIRPETVFL